MKRAVQRLFAVLLSLLLLVSPAYALSVGQALELLEEDYLREIPVQAYEAESLDELTALLGDPYTEYMTQQEYQAFLSSVESTVDTVGIGVTVYLTEAGLLVDQVINGGPAQQAGLAPGDLITAIGGISCAPASDSHLALLSGPQGSTVVLTVLRAGAVRTVRVVRQAIYIPNTQFLMLEDGIGYISCQSFGSDTGRLLEEGLSQYDGQVQTWLLDLRSNPGGYTDSALAAIGAFSGPAYYLFLRDKTGQSAPYAYLGSSYTDSPVILLIDGNTASAAEILAAGLRDQDRAVLIGTRTYGKGVAQLIRDETTDPGYFDGDALKITFAGFYSEKGNTSDQIGVLPTLLLDEPAAESVALALCATPGQHVEEGWLKLQLAGQTLYLDARQTAERTLSALFSALPPSAQVWVSQQDGSWQESSVADAAILLEVDYASRFFSDLSQSPYALEVNTLGTYGLVLGAGAGRFYPEGQLTRAEACALFSRLLSLSYSGPSRFSDVPEGAWYAQDVNAMAALGLVRGVGGGQFAPSSTLTQQEFLTILARVAQMLNFHIADYAQQLSGLAGTQLSQIPALVSFSSWAREGVALLAWSGENVLGQPDATMLHCQLDELSPTSPILREEAAACIYQVLSVTGILTV